MAEPFALLTADPRFNPNEPISVNGYTFAPVSTAVVEAVEIWAIIKALTAGEGDAVTVLCANPDFNGQPNYAIECCGEWTGYEDLRFAHDSQLECFRMAFAVYPTNPSEGGRHEVAAPPNNAGKAGQGSRVDGRVIPARPDYAALGLGSEWEAEGRN